MRAGTTRLEPKGLVLFWKTHWVVKRPILQSTKVGLLLHGGCGIVSTLNRHYNSATMIQHQQMDVKICKLSFKYYSCRIFIH